MNSGLLPPVPDLIPISAVRKISPSNDIRDNSDAGCRNCSDCARSEVMGEQRPRRRSVNHPAAEPIDSAGSRGSSAAPQAPLSRKARSDRHRKSDRRREHCKAARTRSDSKQANSPFPANPRVNPIFVWVRQEDNRIVDVKCEDYDKRNRILLTKTAQGWRAIPRTETLVPSLKEAARSEDPHHHHHHHHHHHKNKKSRKSKIRRRSTGVQVTSDIEQEEPDSDRPEEEKHPEENHQDVDIDDDDKRAGDSPTWMTSDNVNIESLLPSHTIKVKRSTSPSHSPERASNVNSAVSGSAQTPTLKCSADKICDVSPLDNLLAVAELEFNQQIQSGEWNKTSESPIDDNEDDIISYDKSFNNTDDDKEFMRNLEHLNNLIESEENKLEMPTDFEPTEHKSEECDYTEDDDNNLAMDDILSRLEQSLRSPECTEVINCDTSFLNKTTDITTEDNYVEDNDNNPKSVPELENYFEGVDEKTEEPESFDETPKDKPELENVVESSTNDDEEPTDLTMTQEVDSLNENNCDVTEEPTDLSIPKASESPRPPSQNSEAIQSPQPSGIPAVPPSPDIVSTTATNTRPKSAFLESLLSNTTNKIALNSEVTITRQNEPLDLGKCRKSASPTVTCSEEVNTRVNSSPDSEPPMKKMKSVDITLKTLLDPESAKSSSEGRISEKPVSTETPRLLELLKNNSEPDPSTQLKNLLSDPTMNIPDPMLVPKDKFSLILTRPGTEIPRLLKERPELRLPEALAFPHIMQDPNMLVVNIHHLESILSNKISQENESKSRSERVQEKSGKKSERTNGAEVPLESPIHTKRKSNETASKQCTTSEAQTKSFNELANDIDVATQAAFNQMAWLPYINHLEAMSLANNSDMMKMFTNSAHSFPMYVNQMPDFSQMFAGNRVPVPPMGFPMQQSVNYGNPWEMSMWQEAMMQANMLRNKSTLENFGSEKMFKSYVEKMNPHQKKSMMNNNHVGPRMHTSNKHQGYPSHYYKNERPHYQNPYMNASMGQNNSAKQSMQQSHPGGNGHTSRSSTGHRQQGLKGLNNFQNPKVDGNHNFASMFSQISELDSHQHVLNSTASAQETFNHNHHRKESGGQPKPKLSCKPFANLTHHKSVPHESLKEKGKSFGSDASKPLTSQPIDLSGPAKAESKLKVKQHLVDPTSTPRLLKQQEDIPEVGSTTASIEEMQDAHKHLWHPLFGNQKSYTNAWNWTTVTATGE